LSAIWGSSFLFLRLAIQDFGPFLLSDLRVFFAFLSLLPFLIFLKKRKLENLKKIKFLFFLGSINSAIPFVFFSYAAISLPSGYLAVINSFVPVWSLFFSYIFLGEKIKLSMFTSLIIGVLGVMIFVGFGPVKFYWDSVIAIFFASMATLCYAISGVLTRKYCPDVSVINLSIFSLGSAFIILLPSVFFDAPGIFPSSQSWIAIVVLGVLCSGVAMLLYFNLLKTVGPIKTTTVTFLVPAFGTLWGTIFLDEIFTVPMGFGITLILVSSAMVFYQKQ
jgi:drug/metabolite transporter (DMT)-like permease